MGLRERVMEQQAVRKWGEVVGRQIAASSRAERVAEGTLFVSCKSSAWASELTLHKDRIIKSLNESVGARVVTDIRFSARSFRRQAESKEEGKEGPKRLEAVELAKEDIDIARQIAAACPPDLAERVERAILTGKRREKLDSE
jgi:hypothetical protein